MNERSKWITSNFLFSLETFSNQWEMCLQGWYYLCSGPGICQMQKQDIPSYPVSMAPTQLTVIWRDAPRESGGTSGVCGKIAMLNIRLSRWVWVSVAVDTWKDMSYWWASAGQGVFLCVYFLPLKHHFLNSICSCITIFILLFIF